MSKIESEISRTFAALQKLQDKYRWNIFIKNNAFSPLEINKSVLIPNTITTRKKQSISKINYDLSPVLFDFDFNENGNLNNSPTGILLILYIFKYIMIVNPI